MNKKDVLKEIQEKLNLDEEKSNKINSIFEETFIVGKKNKESIISRLKEEINVTEEEANHIYEKVMDIIGRGVLDKIKHPFKDLDKEK